MKTSIKFDDLGTNGDLAVVDASQNYEWVELQIVSFPGESLVRVEVVARGGQGDDHARQALLDYLSEHYEIDIPCDFRHDAEIADAVAKAAAIRDRFLSGNYAPFSA